MTGLVGVHGVRNYRAGHEPATVSRALAETWRTRLAAGPLGRAVEQVHLSVAYYAHHLRDAGAQWDGDGELEDLSGDAEQMLRAWLEEWYVSPGLAQGPGTLAIRQAISWIASRQGLSQKAIERFIFWFFREVSRYLDTPGSTRRKAARDEVAHQIRSAPSPRVVLAHSLGSVVAYEALWSEPRVEVELLVTLGSPLALPPVLRRLQPTATGDRRSRPPGVRHWVNIADVGDLVAVPRGGLPRMFDRVDHDFEDTVHPLDFHMVDNYLACRRLAEVLGPCL